MKQKMYIAIVLGSNIIDQVYVSGSTFDECYDKVFAYADERHGINESYELFDLQNPRHQVLFETESKGMFNKQS